MIFRPKRGYFGAEKKCLPLETSIYILFLIDLLIPVDEQRQVDIFRRRNFLIWSIGTKIMPVLVKKLKILPYLSSKVQKMMILV